MERDDVAGSLAGLGMSLESGDRPRSTMPVERPPEPWKN